MAASPTETTRVIDAPPPSGPRRGARSGRVFFIVAAIVVALAALCIVAEIVVRDIAEQRVAEEIERGLPEGVEGDVDVTFGGISVIAQYLSGTMQEVSISAPEVTVLGSPIAVDVVASDVPVEQGAEIGRVDATLAASEDTVNRFVELQDIPGGVSLGDGTVGYDGTLELLGLPIDYSVTAEPEAAGDTVLLRPAGVEVAAGGGAIDVSNLVDRLLGGEPYPVCVAEYLPEGVEVNDVTVSPGELSVGIEASGVAYSPDTLETRGTCD